VRHLALLFGIGWILVIVWDAFEALVLPRRVTRRLRPTRMFYRTTWGVWSFMARRMPAGGRRETYVSFYGPLSLLVLLSAWAASLIVGFALVQWAVGSDLDVSGRYAGFLDDLYMSGTTFFTLGLGDVTPRGILARVITVLESGLGFGFLAAVIGYLPVVYQAFSRREVNITLLDARAGSPPSAAELLRRHAEDPTGLERLLHEWERWSAEFLESHLSYPVLSYFRSQHDNQSWLAALTTILDTTALMLATLPAPATRQARRTFAIARHAVVDLAQVLSTPPRPPAPERLTPEEAARLRGRLAADGGGVDAGPDGDKTLAELREMYEPYVNALASRLLMPLPAWTVDEGPDDNWRTSAWEDER
jgi:hypothetical protein